MEKIQPIFVYAVGGTAGHIEPALNLAEFLQSKHPEIAQKVLGSSQGMEANLVPARGFKFTAIPVVALPRKINGKLFQFPFKLFKSVWLTRKQLKNKHIVVVIGFGGYVSLPAYLAAKMFFRKRNRKLLFVHEANTKLGVANKIGRFLADDFFSALPLEVKSEVVGIPLRSAIKNIDFSNKKIILNRLGLPTDNKVLLVFGGSQGAASLNKIIWESLPSILANKISIIHIFGKNNSLPSNMVNKFPNYLPIPFQENMAELYTVADLVLCRSGMMTVSEIEYLGLPAVFVPLPHGNGEQITNAKKLVAKGQAQQVLDKDLTVSWVSNHLVPLLLNTSELADMRRSYTSKENASTPEEKIEQAIFSKLGRYKNV